jgi:hypothetical protein
LAVVGRHHKVRVLYDDETRVTLVSKHALVHGADGWIVDGVPRAQRGSSDFTSTNFRVDHARRILKDFYEGSAARAFNLAANSSVCVFVLVAKIDKQLGFGTGGVGAIQQFACDSKLRFGCMLAGVPAEQVVCSTDSDRWFFGPRLTRGRQFKAET